MNELSHQGGEHPEDEPTRRDHTLPASSIKDARASFEGHFDPSYRSKSSDKHSYKHQQQPQTSSSLQQPGNVASQSGLPMPHFQPMHQGPVESKSTPAYAHNQPLSQSSGTHAIDLNQQTLSRTNYNTVTSKPKHSKNQSSKPSTAAQQNVYMPPKQEQTSQHMRQHQKQILNPAMLSYHPGMHGQANMGQFNFNPAFPQSSAQNQPTFPPGLWDANKQSNKNYFPSSSTSAGFGNRPPSYNDAMVAQQRMQDQLYQSLHSAAGLPSKSSNLQPKQGISQTRLQPIGQHQQHQLMQQQQQQQLLPQYQSGPYKQDKMPPFQESPHPQDPQQYFAQQQASMFGYQQQQQQGKQARPNQREPSTSGQSSKKHKHAQRADFTHAPNSGPTDLQRFGSSHAPHAYSASSQHGDSKSRKERPSEVQSLMPSIPSEDFINHPRVSC